MLMEFILHGISIYERFTLTSVNITGDGNIIVDLGGQGR